MIGNFVLTNLYNEVAQIEKLRQDLSTLKMLWESTFVTEETPLLMEKRSRERDLEVIAKVLGDLRELSNDLMGYIHYIEEYVKQKKGRRRADNFETELLRNTSN